SVVACSQLTFPTHRSLHDIVPARRPHGNTRAAVTQTSAYRFPANHSGSAPRSPRQTSRIAGSLIVRAGTSEPAVFASRTVGHLLFSGEFISPHFTTGPNATTVLADVVCKGIVHHVPDEAYESSRDMGSAQFSRDVRCPRVVIALEHLDGLVAGYCRQL